ncbi:MAG: hypothetical protein ABSG17_00445 [Spirochaetia bacterium]|jgi:hypothetical protein
METLQARGIQARQFAAAQAQALSPFPIRFTPHALRKTGLATAQIFLTIEGHVLFCTLYQISSAEADLLAVLNEAEIDYFNHRRSRPCFINLSLKESGGDSTLVLQGTLRKISPMRAGREVGIIHVALSSTPRGLREIIDAYCRVYEGLKNIYETFAGRPISLDSAVTGQLRQSLSTTLVSQRTRMSVTLVSMAVDTLEVVLSEPPRALKVGEECAIQMTFHESSFTANGRIASISRWSALERARVTVYIDFTPEIIEFLDDHFFSHRPHRRSFRTLEGAARRRGATLRSPSALARL